MRMATSLPLGVSTVELTLCHYDFGKLGFFQLYRMCVLLQKIFLLSQVDADGL